MFKNLCLYGTGKSNINVRAQVLLNVSIKIVFSTEEFYSKNAPVHYTAYTYLHDNIVYSVYYKICNTVTY